MPTIPSPLSGRQSHQARELAESFGSQAERYDRARPRYPDAMVAAIVAGSPGVEVVDVGVGTGIAGRQFRAAGCSVLGVEPDERMAEFARRSGLEVEVATFETWEPAGRTFDAVVAGQAWHWVDPVAGAVKAARVLRPGGRLAVFWNVGEPPADVSVYGIPMPARDGYSTLLTSAAAGMRDAGTFGEPEEWRFDWEQSYTRDEWLDQLPTSAVFGQLPPDELVAMLKGIGAAIDVNGGSFTMRYTTVVVTAALTFRVSPRSTY